MDCREFGGKIFAGMEFIWNERNIDHIAKHGITPSQAEYLAEHARPPYPQMIGEGKRLVVGRLPEVALRRLSTSHPDPCRTRSLSFIPAD